MKRRLLDGQTGCSEATGCRLQCCPSLKMRARLRLAGVPAMAAVDVPKGMARWAGRKLFWQGLKGSRAQGFLYTGLWTRKVEVQSGTPTSGCRHLSTASTS